MSTDLYAILGVSETATDAELKKAYQRAALRFHPDRHCEADREQATRQFQDVREAYDVLSDFVRRLDYDALRRSQTDTAASARKPSTQTQETFPEPAVAFQSESKRSHARQPSKRQPSSKPACYNQPVPVVNALPLSNARPRPHKDGDANERFDARQQTLGNVEQSVPRRPRANPQATARSHPGRAEQSVDEVTLHQHLESLSLRPGATHGQVPPSRAPTRGRGSAPVVVGHAKMYHDAVVQKQEIALNAGRGRGRMVGRGGRGRGKAGGMVAPQRRERRDQYDSAEEEAGMFEERRARNANNWMNNPFLRPNQTLTPASFFSPTPNNDPFSSNFFTANFGNVFMPELDYDTGAFARSGFSKAT